MSNPFYNLYSHEPNNGEHLPKFLVYDFEHITKKGQMAVIIIFVSQLGFVDRRYSETPRFVTNNMNIRGIHSA
jgi:hypothetical protein